MAICSTCSHEGARIRTIFRGNESKDECPQCAPQSFEKQTAPSDKKIWIGPEYAPNDYEKRYDSEGVYYMPKPEVTAERERKAFIESDYDERYARAVEEKRKTRRTRPMSTDEMFAALNKANALFRPLIEDPNTNYDA